MGLGGSENLNLQPTKTSYRNQYNIVFKSLSFMHACSIYRSWETNHKKVVNKPVLSICSKRRHHTETKQKSIGTIHEHAYKQNRKKAPPTTNRKQIVFFQFLGHQVYIYIHKSKYTYIYINYNQFDGSIQFNDSMPKL